MKKTLKSILIIVILIFFFLFYLCHISQMIRFFLDYSLLFWKKLVPVSFPILLFSSILISYGFFSFLPISSSASVFFLSLISGFPNGSICAKELLNKKEISKEEGNQILLFSHFPNLFFVFGSVSSVLNPVLTKKVYYSVFLSNVLLFLFCRKKKEKKYFNPIPNVNFSDILSKSIFSASRTILLIYGSSIFFYLFSVFITHYFSFSPFLFSFLCGFFDLTNGVFSTTLFSSFIKRSYLILFFLSFGSLSIHMQIKSILLDTSLSYSSFLKGRFIGTCLSFLIFQILLFF